MTTQLLIYETAVPVSSGRHAKCSVEPGRSFAFTRKVNSVNRDGLQGCRSILN